MAGDPYKVLGVSSGATDDEIKTAYRNLVKKYHPDRYVNSPLQQQAQEKLKEINIAYEQIEKMRSGKGGASGSYDAGGSYGGYGGYGYGGGYSAGGSGKYADIREMFTRNLVQQAAAALDRMTDRDAEWYYLRGVAHFRMGWYAQAQECFNEAVRLEPNNAEYRSAAERMRHMSQAGGGIHVGGKGCANCALPCLCLSSTCCGGGFYCCPCFC